MLTRKRAVAVVFGTLAALVGCGIGKDPGSSSDDIINGSADVMHDSVVQLAILNAQGRVAAWCTATVVAPNMVLTARHCVSDTDESSLCRTDGTSAANGKITSDLEPKNLVALTGRTVDGQALGGRGKQVVTESADVLCDRDVAFIVLDRTIDAPVAPLRLHGGPKKGEILTAVGWGLTEDGVLPDQRMMRPGVEILDIGPLVFDEDGIGIGASEFAVGEAFCSGDSGGPSFSAKGALVGVVSRGGNGRNDPQKPASGCIGDDTVGFYTHLSEKAELVKRAFAAAGATPIDEDSLPDPTAPTNNGDAGSTDDASTDAGDGGDVDASRTPAEPTPTPATDAGTTTPDPTPVADAGTTTPPPVTPTPTPTPPVTPTPTPPVTPTPLPTPVVPPVAPHPNGASCSKNDECTSAACVQGTCLAQCGDGGACSAGNACVTQGSLKVCMIQMPSSPTYPTAPPKGGAATPDAGVDTASFQPPGTLPDPIPEGAGDSPDPSASDVGGGADAGRAKAKPIDNGGCSVGPTGSADFGGGAPTAALGLLGVALVMSRSSRRRRNPRP